LGTTQGKSVLWVYEKGKQIRRSRPELEACEKDFYSFEDNGSRNVEVEEWFSRLEDKIAPIISDLAVARREPTPDEEAWLALFMGTMYTRTPLGRRLSDEKFGPATAQMLKEAAGDPEKFREAYLSVDTGFPDEETAEQVRQDILSGRGEALGSRDDFKLASIIEVGKTVADVLLTMGWRFVYAPDGQRFITSDNPFVSEVSEPGSNRIHFRVGANIPNAGVWFPLTQNLSLMMQKSLTPGVTTVSSSLAREMNKRVMICAERRIYAGECSESLRIAFDRHGCKVPVEGLDLRYEGKKI
jgi:hypothetical protein